MRNLKMETLDVLNNNGKTWQDVKFINIEYRYNVCVTVQNDLDEVLDMMDFEYDEGYGGEEVNRFLVIVGDDFWLERHNYDGSEWWEYKELPTPFEKKIVITQNDLKEE